jgi:hypothetical protein
LQGTAYSCDEKFAELSSDIDIGRSFGVRGHWGMTGCDVLVDGSGNWTFVTPFDSRVRCFDIPMRMFDLLWTCQILKNGDR